MELQCILAITRLMSGIPPIDMWNAITLHALVVQFLLVDAEMSAGRSTRGSGRVGSGRRKNSRNVFLFAGKFIRLQRSKLVCVNLLCNDLFTMLSCLIWLSVCHFIPTSLFCMSTHSHQLPLLYCSLCVSDVFFSHHTAFVSPDCFCGLHYQIYFMFLCF